MNKTYTWLSRRNYLVGSIFVALFAVIGVYLLISSRASSPYASITADKGTLAGGAAAQTCSGSAASSGQCVVFNGTSSGGSTGTPWIGLNDFTGWGTKYTNYYISSGFKWARIDQSGAGCSAGDTASKTLGLNANINVMLIIPVDPTAAENCLNLHAGDGSRIAFEYANEPVYQGIDVATYAQDYQQVYNYKHQAGSNITQPLLFFTTGDPYNNLGKLWLEAAMAAVPDPVNAPLQIDGFVTHTYDQANQDINQHSNGVSALNYLHTDAVNHGFVNQPWYVTEYGFTLCEPTAVVNNQLVCTNTSSTASTWYVPSYCEQEKQLILGFNQMMTYGDGQAGTWLKGIMWYQTHDDSSTGDYGLFTDLGASGTDNAGETVGQGTGPGDPASSARPAYGALKQYLTANSVAPITCP